MTNRIVLFVAGGAAVVALSVVYLWRVETPAPTVATRPGELAAVGVRQAEIDSAQRRVDEEPPTVAPEVPVLPVTSPEREPGDDPRRGVVPAPEPPVAPSADAVAESEAVLAVRKQVEDQVKATLDDRHRALRNACWKGARGSSASFPVQASFGADGGLLALSIADDRTAPAGVGACVRAQPLPLKVDPPGVAVTVDVALSLP